MFFINIKRFKTLPKIYTEIVRRDDFRLLSACQSELKKTLNSQETEEKHPIISKQRRFLSPTEIRQSPSRDVNQKWIPVNVLVTYLPSLNLLLLNWFIDSF
jgi:hypothetical protein